MQTLVSVIITLLSILSTRNAIAQQRCQDIYSSNSLLEVLDSYPAARIQREAWEVEATGEIFTIRDGSGMGQFLRSREGTYPILILRTGEILTSHRLPDRSVNESDPYLATHRSLVNHYRNQTGQEADIVFAGEILVVLGEIRSVVDMSGGYHFRLSDLGPKATDAQLIIENGVRLDLAATLLRSLGAFDPNTNLVNYWANNYLLNPANRGNGHILAKDAALFELRCFGTPACWEMYQNFEQFLLDLNQAGGAPYYSAKLRETKDPTLLDHYILLVEFPVEGIIPVLTRPHIRKNGWLDRFMNDIPAMRQTLELE